MTTSGRIDAVLFDFDGTLTRAGSLDFARIREEIGCPPEEGILRFIESRPSEAERRSAEAILLEHERRAAAESVPNHAAEETVREIHAAGLRIAILTRNTRASVERAFENFTRLRPDWFELVITRDEGEPLKPDPGAVREAARRLGVDPAHLMMVGDYRHDIDAGHGAGSWTTLIRGHEGRDWMEEIRPDYVIRSLAELPGILRWHRPLETGKLPNAMLAELLAGLPADGEVVVPPGVGEDVGGIDASGTEVLLAKSDPITFPAEHIGRQAITINANDVVCSGGDPRWFLATAIFPPGTTGAAVRAVFSDMVAAAADLGIAVVGGHTEISDAVVRPVVAGALLGRAPASGLLRKAHIRPGDRILLTKRPGIEGTAIIATEFPRTLAARGVSRTVIEAAAAFDARIPILPEARRAAQSGRAVALHDVTEGGVATALVELAQAAGVGLDIDLDALEPYPETAAICEALGLDPLGLIGSGSLIIAVREGDAGAVLATLAEGGIEAREVGRAVEPTGSAPTAVPVFNGDELARLYREMPTPR